MPLDKSTQEDVVAFQDSSMRHLLVQLHAHLDEEAATDLLKKGEQQRGERLQTSPELE